MNDTLIRIEGMEALMEKLGHVEAERFIMLIKREPFDYTKWREKNLFKGQSIETIFAEAAARRARMEKAEKAKAPQPRKTKGTTTRTAATRRKASKRLAHA